MHPLLTPIMALSNPVQVITTGRPATARVDQLLSHLFNVEATCLAALSHGECAGVIQVRGVVTVAATMQHAPAAMDNLTFLQRGTVAGDWRCSEVWIQPSLPRARVDGLWGRSDACSEVRPTVGSRGSW